MKYFQLFAFVFAASTNIFAADSKPIAVGADGRGYLTDQTADGTTTTRIFQMKPEPVKCTEVKQVDKSGNAIQWYQNFYDDKGHEILCIVRKVPSNSPNYGGIVSIWTRTYNKNGNVQEEYAYNGNGTLLDHAIHRYSGFNKWTKADHYDANGNFTSSTSTPPESFLYGEKSK